MVLLLEHMVVLLERFNLEELATRNTIRILRLLIFKPFSRWGLSELSKELQIAKSNVFRIMKVLRDNNIVLVEKSGRKKLYRINYQLNLVRILWKLFMEERRQNISIEFKNIIDLLYHQIRDQVHVFILFGSVAQGLATRKSDIDVCVVPKDHIEIDKYDYLPYRFEIHEYSWADLSDPVDFVVLESLLNGIVFKGELFKTIAETRSFPKSYILYRLHKSKEFLNRAKTLENEAKSYYEKLAEITVGEIKSLLVKGETIPKKEINIHDIENDIKFLEKLIASEGDRVWLI